LDRAVAELNLHTSILENEHHERMDLPALQRARLLLSQTWQFCVLDSSQLNAFVVAVQPRRIFITVPIALMCQNDDELAMILGHEISHALCGHTEQSLYLEVAKAALVTFLFSMVDPTGGVMAFLVDGAVLAGTTWDVLGMQFSQAHEHEADTLGINIMAQACYDPRKGSAVMARFVRMEHGQDFKGVIAPINKGIIDVIDHEASFSWNISNLLKTHPPSPLRYKNLETLAPLLSRHYLHICGSTTAQHAAFQTAYHEVGWNSSEQTGLNNGSKGITSNGSAEESASWLEWLFGGWVQSAAEAPPNPEAEFEAHVPHMKVVNRVVADVAADGSALVIAGSVNG
jgi:Zn-dependent protease with chaperone function